jgi:uncharacterized protein YeaO (DUF488 family)
MAARLMTKRIYDPPSAGDGARILIDRIWPRGVSKDAAELTEWLKEIAPSTSLRQWFHRDQTRWTEFGRRYRAELDANPEAVARLCDFLKGGPITLLYASRDRKHNHAAVLADYLNDKA